MCDFETKELLVDVYQTLGHALQWKVRLDGFVVDVVVHLFDLLLNKVCEFK